MSDKNSNSGFSMVEMAISLSIIGLIVAAVVTGANIKHKLELQQMVEDIGTIKTAVENFKTKYGSYPGDMYNAESVFGAANTDDGNGNGTLANEGPDTNTNEQLLFWQHLSLAGLIKGTYDGATAGSGGEMESPFKNTYYTAVSNVYDIAIVVSKGGALTANGFITPKEAYEIDLKYDDGNWSTGYIQASHGLDFSSANCKDAAPDYNLDYTGGTSCYMLFTIVQDR